jgi:cyclophilin family peptidyl-prolyl cis-trans isomerase
MGVWKRLPSTRLPLVLSSPQKMLAMKRLSIALIGCAAFFVFCNASGCKSSDKTTAEKTVVAPAAQPEPAAQPAPAAAPTDPSKAPLVRVSTRFGNMTVMLYNETPQHRDNFLKLVKEKYYDDLLFHRCIKTFMIQGGDPQSRGAAQSLMLGGGGPGYTVPAEFNSNLVHKRGALCAARQGDQINPKKASSGSQFYIVQGRTWSDMELNQLELNIGRNNPGFKYTDAQRQAYKTTGGTAQLDMEYTVFGEVVDGFAVIDSINNQKTMRDRPVVDITMKMEVINR